MGLRPALDGYGEGKNLLLLLEFEIWTVQPVANRCTVSACMKPKVWGYCVRQFVLMITDRYARW